MIVEIILSKWFLLNWIIGILLIEYAFIKTKVVRKVNEERDSKFPAFRRTDVNLWKRGRLYLMAPLTFPRFALCIMQLFYELPLSKLILLGHKSGDPVSNWKKAFLKGMT